MAPRENSHEPSGTPVPVETGFATLTQLRYARHHSSNLKMETDDLRAGLASKPGLKRYVAHTGRGWNATRALLHEHGSSNTVLLYHDHVALNLHLLHM